MPSTTTECGPKIKVAALAGRRVDAEDAQVKRFPHENVEVVEGKLLELFRRERIGMLVCSAACGADLIALALAIKLGIKCRIVIPYDSKIFRKTSVTDRPGNWGQIYDRVMDTVKAQGGLITLSGLSEGGGAFSKVNRVILREAAAAGCGVAASILVWEGKSRGNDDTTAEFRRLALHAGMKELTVLTCDC